MRRTDVSSGPRRPSLAAEEHLEERSAGLNRQRERLLSTMVETVAHGGYARTSIGELARRAGISRATFYELYPDKEACFLAAFVRQEQRLLAHLGGADTWPDHAMEFACGALAAFATENPRTVEFLLHEALLAGAEAARRRDALARLIHERVLAREADATRSLEPLAAPRELILGAVLRLLVMRSKSGALAPRSLATELSEWIGGYRAPEPTGRWRELTPVPGLIRPPGGENDGGSLRRSVPKGRHGLSAEAVRSLQRERIAYGTALAIHERGYAEATVSQIVSCAGVSRDVFYSEFHDKHEAFNEAAKLVFEQLLAKMASAYYGSAASWPQRVWDAGCAFCQFLEDNPVLAHFLFVGTSAPHPQVDRVNEYVMAFKVFIDDGFAHGPRSAALPRVTSDALVCAVLAIVTFKIREGRIRELRGLVPAIVYTVLAPFLGRESAEKFVDGQVAAALSAR